eukprot:g20465.t1
MFRGVGTERFHGPRRVQNVTEGVIRRRARSCPVEASGRTFRRQAKPPRTQDALPEEAGRKRPPPLKGAPDRAVLWDRAGFASARADEWQ